MDTPRSGAERRYLAADDAQPEEAADSANDVLASAAQVATIGIFLLLVIAALYYSAPLLVPVVMAVLVGFTLAPLVKRAARLGVPASVTAVVLTLMVVALGTYAVTLLTAPVTEWIGRAPELVANLREKLFVLEWPLAAWREVQNLFAPQAANQPAVEAPRISDVAPAVLGFVTPALVQAVLFLGTLVFVLAAQTEFRRNAVSLFDDRASKLTVLRIATEVENNLASYVGTVTMINAGLGVVVTFGAWAYGFPNPWIIGLTAALLNYIPYLGALVMAAVLLAVGLVTFPSLSYALLPPATYLIVTSIEGNLITPTILGRRLTLNPLTIFLSLAFWTWLWGVPGTFMAVPLTIVGLVIYNHLVPSDDGKLPE